MTSDDLATTDTPLDAVMEDIREEIVRRAVDRDVDDNRDIYDALADV